MCTRVLERCSDLSKGHNNLGKPIKKNVLMLLIIRRSSVLQRKMYHATSKVELSRGVITGCKGSSFHQQTERKSMSLSTSWSLFLLLCSCVVQRPPVVDQICANHNLQALQGKPGCLADQATRQPPISHPPPAYNPFLTLSHQLPGCASFLLLPSLPWSILLLASTSRVFESLTIDLSNLPFLLSPAQMFLYQVNW